MCKIQDRIDEIEYKILNEKLSGDEFRKLMSEYHALCIKSEANDKSKKKVVNGCHVEAYRFVK